MSQVVEILGWVGFAEEVGLQPLFERIETSGKNSRFLEQN